ncbi:unnamed protein product [Aspergillus oryzae]|uniref:Unnamed protein product n=2 Tax=Aspergillus oryzae TaxID=5062 RepID=A0AAN5BX19_ASPOZ|nr:unnamed protein product [Aspergillus oryzae]GMF92475.1 unnamed protein product [Aspergillus oryzae]GMG03266.1 unnamed protein product [Aspergillus oryzae]GMG37102.1 unnamed protein product [Aspergillus oryzae]GMG46196.1 unnamed protein product [Aspergillus oryzae var. brunneus]
MADVEMKEASAGASAKGKGASKASEGASDGKKKFEVKKWNAVALWAWDIVVDNCAICRNHIMDLCMTPALRYCRSITKHKCFRYRVSSKPRFIYDRRVYSCLGDLQCESRYPKLLDKFNTDPTFSSLARVPFPLHIPLAENSPGLSPR